MDYIRWMNLVAVGWSFFYRWLTYVNTNLGMKIQHGNTVRFRFSRWYAKQMGLLANALSVVHRSIHTAPELFGIR